MKQIDVLKKEKQSLTSHIVEVGKYVRMTIGLGSDVISKEGYVTTSDNNGNISITSSLGKAILGKEVGSSFVWEVAGSFLYGVVDEVSVEKTNTKTCIKILERQRRK